MKCIIYERYYGVLWQQNHITLVYHLIIPWVMWVMWYYKLLSLNVNFWLVFSIKSENAPLTWYCRPISVKLQVIQLKRLILVKQRKFKFKKIRVTRNALESSFMYDNYFREFIYKLYIFCLLFLLQQLVFLTFQKGFFCYYYYYCC